MSKIAVFRADAYYQIGTGHIVRCGILAEKLKLFGFKSYFLCTQIPEGLEQQLLNRDFEVVRMPDLPEEPEYLLDSLSKIGKDTDHKILIVDSDRTDMYNGELQQQIRQKWKLMYFTFFSDYHFHADIILNQNIRGPVLDYSVEPHTKLLLGTKYVILKDDYHKLQNELQPDFNQKDNVCLLFFGGADLGGRTLYVLRSILLKPELFSKIIVVTGVLNKSKKELQDLVDEAPMEVEFYINTPRMPELMAEAKYAITSGGLTTWEMATLHTLQLIIPSSERELTTVEYCSRKGWVHHLKNADTVEDKVMVEEIAAAVQDPGNSTRVADFAKEISVDGAQKVAHIIYKVVCT